MRRIVYATCTFVVLLVVLYVFRQALFGRWVANEVGEALSDAMGVPVRVERVLGSWVSDARIEQITIDTSEAHGALAGFDADALIVRFDLWEVLFGDVVQGIEGVEAENLKLTLDFTRETARPDTNVSLEEIVAAVPRRFPNIDIQAHLTCITGLGLVEVASVQIRSPGDEILRLDAEQIVLPEPAGLAGALHARIRRDNTGLVWQSDSDVAGLRLQQVTAGTDGSLVASGRAADADFRVRVGKRTASLRTGRLQIAAVPDWVMRLLPTSVLRPRDGALQLELDASSLSPLRMEARLEGANIDLPDEHVRTLNVRARLEPGRFTLTEAHIAARDGQLRAEDLAFVTEPALRVASLKRVDLSVANIQSWIDTDRALAVEIRADSADASRVKIHTLTLEGPGTSLRGSGQFDVPDDLEGFEHAQFEAQLAGSLTDHTFGVLDLDGTVQVDARAHGTILAPRIEGRVSGSDLRVDGRAVQRLDVKGSWLDEDLDLTHLVLESEAASVRGSTRLRMEPLRIDASNVQFDIRDLATVRAWIPDESLPTVRGAARGSARLKGTLRHLEGSVELAASGLFVAGTQIGSVQLKAVAQGEEVVVSSAHARGNWGTLTGRGSLRLGPRTAKITALDGQIEGHTLALRAPLDVAFRTGLSIRGLNAEALGGTLQGEASWTQALTANLTFENIDLAALRDDVQGRATGALVLGEGAQTLRVTVPALVHDGHTGRVEIDVLQNDAKLDIRKLVVDAGASLQLEASGALPLRIDENGIRRAPAGGDAFTLKASTDDLSQWVDAPIRAAKVTATGKGDRVEADVHLEELELIPRFRALAALDAKVSVGPDGASVKGTVVGDPRVAATIDVRTPAGWVWTRPEEGPQRLADIALDGGIRLQVPNGNDILALLPDAAIQVDGMLQGDMTVGGTLDAIKMGGRVWGGGLKLRLRDVPGYVDLIDLEAFLIREKLRITKVELKYKLGKHAALPAVTDRPAVAPEHVLNIPELEDVNAVLADLESFTGDLHGRLEIHNVPDNPSLDGWVRGKALRVPVPDLATDAFARDFEILLKGNRVIVEELRVEVGDAAAGVQGWLEIPVGPDERELEEMPLDATATLKSPDLAKLSAIVPELAGVKGVLDGRLRITKSLQAPSIEGGVTASNLEIPVPGWSVPLRVPQLRVDANETRVEVKSARLQWGPMAADLSGTIQAPARFTDDWTTQPVDARLSINAKDLSLLKDVSTGLRRMNGRIVGDVQARGTLRNPVLSGAVELQNVRGALPGSLPSVDQVSGRLTLQDRTIRIENMRGQLGHSPFTITGSATIPENDVPRVDVRLRGDNLRLVQSRDMRLRADVNLNVVGRFDDLRTQGTMRITDLVYVASMNFLGGGPETAADGVVIFRFPYEPLASMKLDVRVRADNTIRVRTNVLAGNVSADMHFGGTGRTPLPKGRVFFNDVLVKLPFSSLKVDAGELRFDEVDPTSPVVEVLARTEMKGYDLGVRVSGRTPDVELNVTSVPPLRQNEAILLLTTGATSEELREEGLARAALTRIGSVFGQSLLSGGRGPTDPDERGFFDRFTFTQGRRVSRTGADTLEAEFELTDRFYLRVEQDRYDDFNAGVLWRWRFR